MKQYIKDGIIKTRNQIVIKGQRTIKDKDGNDKVVGTNTFNPTEEMILADGWVEYIPPVVEPKKSRMQVMQEIVLEQYNARIDIPDEEALDRAVVIFDWNTYIGKTLNEGQCVVYNEEVYRVRQTHTVQEHYAPSLDTASLYEVIVLTASGTIEDPIPYTPPMEIFEGKYYTQFDVLYKCTRSSGVALTHDLFDLRGLYVELIEK
jgi:hypothetical protein